MVRTIVPGNPQRAWNRLEWERAMLASMSDSDDPLLVAYREVWTEYGGADVSTLMPGAVVELPDVDFPGINGLAVGLGLVAGLRLQRTVLEHLESIGEPVSRSDLFRLLNRNVSARELDDALDGLVSRRLVSKVKGPGAKGGGRPPVLIALVSSS